MISKDYNDYKKEVLALYNDYVKTFESFGEEVNESVRKTADKIEKKIFNLMVLGESKSGKSTFINAYLGKEILPMDVRQCTSAIIKIKYGDEFKLVAKTAVKGQTIINNPIEIIEFLKTHASIDDKYRNIPVPTINNDLLIEYGRQGKKISDKEIEEFSNAVANDNIYNIDINEYNEAIRNYIKEKASEWEKIIIDIDITYKLPDAMKDITIIDSPGIGASGNFGEIAEKYIKEANAIIFVKYLKGQAIESKQFMSLIRSNVSEKHKKFLFLVFNGKSDLSGNEFNSLKEQAIEIYKNDIEKEKILFVDSKIHLFLNKCKELETEEKIDKFFDDLYKEKNDFAEASNIWLRTKDSRIFFDRMEDKSDFVSVKLAIEKFAQKANYLQLKEFLNNLKKSYMEYKDIFSKSLKIAEENKNDPFELENKINLKIKEINDTLEKMNDGIRDIEKEYIGEGENSGKIKNEIEIEKNKYKEGLSNFTEFNEMKNNTMNIIDKFKDFRREKANEIIKECDKKLIEYSNSQSEINAEEFTPNFTEADFDSIEKSAIEEANEIIEEKECFGVKKINRFNKDKYTGTIKNAIFNNLDDITLKLYYNLKGYFDNCLQKYKDKLKEHTEKLETEYKKLRENKENNDKLLTEIENYKKNIFAIDENIKNIDNLKGEINNYVKQ